MKRWELLIVLFSSIMASCATFDPGIINPPNDPIENRIAKLEVSTPKEQRVADESIKTVNIQSLYYTAFERELNENIFDGAIENKGYIELNIIYDRFAWTGEVLTYVGASLCFLPCLIGVPYTAWQQYTEVEVKIFNLQGKEIKRYVLNKQKDIIKGLYYGNDIGDVETLRLVVFKEILSEFRKKIRNDSKYINEVLNK